MFALSTSWNAQRHTNGKEMIEEIKKIGFNAVELNFTLTSEMVEEVIELCQINEIKVVSIHNFCPIPEGLERLEALPDYYSLSSLDNTQREKAIENTKRTIDTAKELNAEAVILHTGRVEIEEKTKALMGLYDNGLKNTVEYERIKLEMMRERREKREPFLDKVLESLEKISDYAKRKDISIGVENRYYFQEIPSFDEIEIILDRFKNRNIFYWHDVGHAQNFENLGLAKHQDYLDRFADRMIGIHLHDIIGTQDHRAPLMGKFNFEMLTPFLKEKTIKVLEVHYPTTAEEIKRGRDYLEKILGGKDD